MNFEKWTWPKIPIAGCVNYTRTNISKGCKDDEYCDMDAYPYTCKPNKSRFSYFLEIQK